LSRVGVPSSYWIVRRGTRKSLYGLIRSASSRANDADIFPACRSVFISMRPPTT
jgi:hypothetical protein